MISKMTDKETEIFNNALESFIEQYKLKVETLDNGTLLFRYKTGEVVDMFNPNDGSLLLNLDKLCSTVYEILWPRKKEEHSILNDFMKARSGARNITNE